MTFEQKVEMNLHLKEVKVKRKKTPKWIVHFEATINLSTILIMNVCFNLNTSLMFSTFSSSSKLTIDIPTLVFPCPFASSFVPNLQQLDIQRRG
jgi:hypothetical protein